MDEDKQRAAIRQERMQAIAAFLREMILSSSFPQNAVSFRMNIAYDDGCVVNVEMSRENAEAIRRLNGVENG